MTTQNIKKLITIEEVARRLGISRSTCERMRRKPDVNFPKSIKIGENSVRYEADELERWIESKREK